MAEGLEIVITADAANATKNLANLNKSLNQTSKASAQTGTVLNNLSRVAQDAPYGFIGIANNINPLLESFQSLKQESGSTGKALKSMAVGLTGAGGLGLAVGVISSLLVVFSGRTKKAGEDLELSGEQAKKAALKIKEAGDAIAGSVDTGGYADAVKNVNKLREAISLARQGFINKKEVVDEYNSTIGKTTGYVTTLDQAEQALAKNADAYIKFTLLKAAANLALDEAAKKVLASTKKQFEPLKLPQIKFNDDPNAIKMGEMMSKAITGIRDATVTELKQESDDIVKIANNLFKQAGEIAKQYGFSFFDANKENKAAKEIEDVVKRLRIKSLDLTMPLNLFAELNKNEFGPFLKNQDFEKYFVNKLKNIKPIPLPIPIAPKPNLEVDKLKEEVEALLSKALQNISVEGFAALGESIGTAIASGNIGEAFKGLFTFIGDSMQQLGKQIIAMAPIIAALKAAIKTLNPAALLPAGIALVAIGAALKNITPKGFAAGGIVSGPVNALVGEGLGTSVSNPEVIAPLDKLKKLIGGGGGEFPDYLPQHRISGDALLLWYEKANKSKGRRY
jgi:hypothetical protein